MSSIIRVIATSDTHNNYPVIRGGDVFIHCGDMTARGSTEELDKVFDWMLGIPCQTKICIAGNHDFGLERGYKPPEEIIYLENSGVDSHGLKIWGSPYVPEFYNWAFMKPRNEMKTVWRNIPTDLSILITHGPPEGIMDRTGTDHAGCGALLEEVSEKMPRFHFFGHIHEGYGRIHDQFTTFANVAFVGVDAFGRPTRPNPPQVFDILV